MKTDRQNKRNLILLPGLDGTGILFDNLVEQLEGKFHVTRIAYPTHILCSLDELAEIVKTKIPDPLNSIILAESFSGLVTLILLEKLTVPPKGIIFGMCFVEPPFKPLLRVVSKLSINHIPWSWLPDVCFQRLCLGNSATARQISSLRDALSQVTAKVLLHRLKMVLNFQAPNWYENWPIPCGYIQANHDCLVAKKAVVWFSQNFEPFFIKKTSGPHFLFQSKVDQCASYILDFEKYLETGEEVRLKIGCKVN